MKAKKIITRERRAHRVRTRLKSTQKDYRLVVFKSLVATYAQIVDEKSGKIVAAASDLKSKAQGTKVDRAKEVGLEIGKKAVEQKIDNIAFDRNGYKYHGRVKAVAEGAREAGLNF